MDYIAKRAELKALMVEQYGSDAVVWADRQVCSYFATEVDTELAHYRALAEQRNTLARAAGKANGRRFGDFQHSAFEVLS